MSPPNEVCVDAGLAVKAVTDEFISEVAAALFAEWDRSGVRLIASSFFTVESDSILRQKVVLRRELLEEDAELVFTRLRALPIRHVSARRQRERSWQIAKQFNLPVVYDATYLALADLRRCEFWTADERLVSRVSSELTFVRWLGDYTPSKKE